MNITSIIIRKLTPENKMKAIVSITFEDAFVVHDVKIIDGANGLFIAMPSRRIQDGEFKDIVHPIHSGFREELSRAVLSKYYEALERYRETNPHPDERVEERAVSPERNRETVSSESDEREKHVVSDERLSFSSSYS
ncbi:MAG: septation regulator SpoVG [Clostridiaceae bacterium]|nr:septation regulator SpoVG [Clostridiaceae bacterium]